MKAKRPPRHHRIAIGSLPSIVSWKQHNRRTAADARERAIARLVCQERGCKEGLATIELDPDAEQPRVRLALFAPWSNEPTDDRRVLHRIRLRGATDPTSDGQYLTLAWAKGSRMEFICHHGHESKFGAGHLAQRLRGVLS